MADVNRDLNLARIKSYTDVMRKWLNNQRENLFLYVPFLIAAGAGVYFTIDKEPNFIGCIIFFLIAIILIFFKRTSILLRAIGLGVFGFCYAAIFTNLINTPIIKHDLRSVNISAMVKSIDYVSDKTRIYLNVNADDIHAGTGNAIIRISLTDDVPLPEIGDEINFQGALFKPANAYAPESFDYARWAYFNNLTANGYATDIKIINHKNFIGINSIRNYLHDNAKSFLADTLVLGYKNAVPKEDNEIWTATGIGHVWSISGFHMTLVGGWLFAIFYLIFRSIPYITRRYPAKIPAMGAAWLGLLLYLFLSGIDVATVRAFAMTTLMFLAFAFGRSVISMRNIAIVFCFIFLINPHYVMQAGFQLSFMAVWGLIWMYSIVKPKMPQNKFLRIIYACVLTSVVATIFTTPFVAMHFGKIPIYSLIGNLILLPIFSVVIMPCVLIGTISAIFNIRLPLDIADWAYDSLINVAKNISDLPLANLQMPHISNIAIILFICAFIGLTIVKPIKIKINYILFCVFVVAGILTVIKTPKPIFYASNDHELVAFLRDDGKLEFNKSRASNHYFAFDTWKQRNGEPTKTKNIRRTHERGVYRYKNIVYIQKFVPLMNNIKTLCKDDNVDYIISYFDIKSEQCANKIQNGAILIYEDGRVEHPRYNRLWN